MTDETLLDIATSVVTAYRHAKYVCGEAAGLIFITDHEGFLSFEVSLHAAAGAPRVRRGE